MYVEFKPGEKYSAKAADQSKQHDSFKDAGYVLQEHEIVIDIDCLSKETVAVLIQTFDIKTQIVWTERGAHLYFKKPEGFRQRATKVCALGFPVEFKHHKNTLAVTIKREGKVRIIENEGIREDLPDIFFLNKKFENLIGYEQGDGRNNALFKHRTKLAGVKGWENYLRFINQYVFNEPLDETEFVAIIRDLNVDAEKDNEPLIAEFMMREYKMVNYGQKVYFYHQGDFKSNEPILKRLIFDKVGMQKTRYVDEVLKQIEYRTPLVEDDKTFDIKFENGILRDGQFIEVEYDEFTPYHIKIEYDPDAKPVAAVDEYMKHLTQGDEQYKKLLYEILAHTLIVNKEFKRLLAKFFIFVGDGGNGKGTLLQIIKMILGAHNCTGLSISNMSDERYFVTMKGKLANLGDDIQDEPINNEQMKQLKNISTCDFISARELYKQSTDTQLTISLIFTSNHVLKSFEKGKSYKRRVIWLPMFTEVKEDSKDPLFISKLTTSEALEYWIKNIIDGYFRLYARGRFTQCELVDAYNGQYHKENNTALLYLDDYTDEQIVNKKLSDIHLDYEVWAEDNALSIASKRMMQDAIRDRFGLGIGVKKINGKSMRVFMRIDETSQL